MFMSENFPHLHWLDGERVERGGGVKGERRELERELGRLETIGEDGEEEQKGNKEPECKFGILIVFVNVVNVV